MFEKYDAYKDSSVEWIGKIPSHWEIKKNKYLFEEVNIRSENGAEELLSVSQYTGVSLKKDKINENGMLTNAESLEGYKVVKSGNLVINIMLAWNGSLGVSQYNGIVSPAYDVFLLKDYCTQYFHYLLRTEMYKAEYKRKSTGVIESRLRLYSDSFFSIKSIVPSILEQRQIAKFLEQKTSEIDQAIAIKEQQIALLNERKQIVIQKAVTQGLNPNVAMKDSGVEWIGHIPEDWNIDRLGTILEPISKKGYADKQLLSITREKGVIVRDVEDDSENHNFIPDDLTNYKLIEAGQFGMNKMKAWQGSYGVSAYTGIVSPAYYIFRFIKPIYPEFFHWAIRSKLYVSFFGSASDGVRIGQWDLSKDRMKQIPFVFPSLEQQKTIADYLTQQTELISEGIKQYSAQIEKLKEYKTTLINDAVTGKIKVA